MDSPNLAYTLSSAFPRTRINTSEAWGVEGKEEETEEETENESGEECKLRGGRRQR